MFVEDQIQVQEYATRNPGEFFNVVMLAVASANCPFYLMGDVMADIAANGETSKWLRGCKRDGYIWLSENHYSLYDEFISVWIHNPLESKETAFRRLLAVPGLGLVKAGFAVQLLLGEIGCIDQHNREMYGIEKRDLYYRKHKLTTAGKERKAQNYINICAMNGGSEYLWDIWCNHIAKVYPNEVFQSGQAVSQYHWEVLP